MNIINKLKLMAISMAHQPIRVEEITLIIKSDVDWFDLHNKFAESLVVPEKSPSNYIFLKINGVRFKLIDPRM